MHSTQYYTQQTLASWDEAAARHEEQNKHLFEHVKDPDFNNLNHDFNSLIDDISIQNKSVVQVCCNNGIDLISLKNKGAGYCLGIDGSSSFINQAQSLLKNTSIQNMDFLHSDIYALPDDLAGRFDVVLLTVGVIYWMPDLNHFMKICAGLLKPNGQILMEEMHPILGMYEEGNPSYAATSYFEKEPFKDETGLDYFTYENYEGKPNYWFQHTVSDLITAAIKAELTLVHFKELSYNIGNYCADLEKENANPPLGMNIMWDK